VQVETGLQWLEVSLRGYGGEAPTGDTFFASLGSDPPAEFRRSPSLSAWQAARLVLFSVDMRDLGGFQEPSEEFAARIARGFSRAAEYLSKCQPGALDQWRSGGRNADIFVGGRLANEQFDLELPAPFLRACGWLELSVQVCTND
jgi:hypothetical protein